MKHTVLARSYPSVLQRYDPGGIAFVKIHTPAELRLSTPLMKEVQMVDLDLVESAYRQGVECAEELCRQVFAEQYQRVTGNKLIAPAAVIGSPGNSSAPPFTGSVVKK